MDFCNDCLFNVLEINKLFQESFEKVGSNDLMNKMQLKLLGYLAYKIKTKVTKHNHLVSTLTIFLSCGAHHSINFQPI